MDPQSVPPQSPLPRVALAKWGHPPLFLALLSFFLLLASLYLYYQNMQLKKQIDFLSASPTQPLSQSPNNNQTNWITYTNNSIGYVINYPHDWYLDTDVDGHGGNITLRNYVDSDVDKEEAMKVFFGTDPSDKIYLNLSVYDELIYTNEKLIDWLKNKDEYTSDMSGNPLSVKETDIAGNPGLILDYSGVGNIYIFRAGNRVFHAYFGPRGTNQSQIFNQILSTFKFMDQTPLNSCAQDADCGINVCDCVADLNTNIPNAKKACTRFCDGLPKCVNNTCKLIK